MVENYDHDAPLNTTVIGDLVDETLDRLALLLGVWAGRGWVEYPTIESFAYTETTRFQRDPGYQFLRYEQKTVLIDNHEMFIRDSHWEAGILRPSTNGHIELANVQGSGRVEVLHGEFLINSTEVNALSLRFDSVLIGNDKRVRSSSREWHLREDQLHYRMRMATNNVQAPTLHLEANLYRQE